MRVNEAMLRGRKKRSEDGWAATTTAIVSALIGSAVSAYGAYSAGQAQKSAQDFNAKVANNNALAAEQQSSADAQKIRDRNRRLVGTQVADLSAAGVDTGGSGADIIYDSKVQGELDALTTLYKGKVQGANYRSQSQLDSMSGSAAATAGYFNAGGTILSGVGQSATDYAIANNNPSFKRSGN